MRSFCSLLSVALTLAFMTPQLLADDIILKSGEKLENVKVLKKSEKRWRIRLLSGKTRSLKPGDIEKHIEKPTLLDEFKERRKTLGKKDVEGMVALGAWALDKGIKTEAKKLLAKVIKLDKKNERARELLGHEKGSDGKWRSGSQLKAYKNKQVAGEMKARGWVKHKGEWVSPQQLVRLKAGLVEHDGRWVTANDKMKLVEGLTWFMNDWYSAEDLKRIDEKKELREGGSWHTISKLNGNHVKKNAPWVLQSEHFTLTTNQSFRKSVLLLSELERVWPTWVDILGEEPVCFDRLSRIPLTMEGRREDYGENTKKRTPDKRQDAYKHRCGAVAVNGSEVVGYWFDPVYTMEWFRHATIQAMMDRMWSQKRLKSNGWEALGAYSANLAKKGKWGPTQIPGSAIRGWKHKDADPFEEISKFDLTTPKSSTEVEAQWARLGYSMHWIVKNHRELFDEWMASFRIGKSGSAELVSLLKAKAGKDEESILADFRRQLRTYQKTHQDTPNPKLKR